MILDSFLGVCCWLPVLQKLTPRAVFFLHLTSSIISPPWNSLTDSPVVKLWGTVYAKEAGRQKCIVTNAGFSPVVYLPVCKAEVQLCCACQMYI